MKTKLLKKLIRMSKYAVYSFILQGMFCSFALSHNSEAQVKRLNEIYLKVSFNQVSLQDVLRTIEQNTDFTFAYLQGELPEINITLSGKKRSLEEVLLSIAEQSGVSFRRVKETIHVKKSSNNLKKLEEIFQVSQQSINISGQVTSEDSPDGLPGVNVILKGTLGGTVTDVNGKYSLEVPSSESILVFSSVGYVTEEVVVGSRSMINVRLIPDVTALEEIVVVGYGVQKKRDLTGAISSVGEERLTDIPATNLAASLQGSVAGVNISTPYGAPGAGSSILIRGLNSINASNSPLVIIDGIPGGSIDDITPTDIKSIEVLKDAASTSIYGSRATNGVIIITTKGGNAGKITVNYEGYMAISSLAHKVDMLNTDEYLTKRREMHRLTNNLSLEDAQNLTVETILGEGYELDMYNLGKSYDWQDELFKSAPMHGHSLSLNGGDEKTQYYLSANWVDQQGIVKNSSYERESVRANISSKVNNWMKLGTNTFITRSLQQRIQDAIFSAGVQISPLAKMFEDEDTKDKYTLYPMRPDLFIANPFTEIEIKDHRERTRLMNGTFVEISFLKNLTYKITANSILDFTNNKYFTPAYTKQVEAFDKYESASIRRDYNRFLNIENLLNYNQTFGNHTVGATFVFATENYKGSQLYGYGKDFGTEYYTWTALQLGNVDERRVTSEEENTFLESIVGRINYSYQGKYLAQFSIRRDRSSKFAPGNRDAVFPGGSIGWRIGDEGFMKGLTFIDDLKLRLSYAHTGNQGIGYRSIYNEGKKIYYTTGQDASGNIVDGLIQTTLANKNLKWESSRQSNVGLDFSLFRGKLSGAVEAYQTKTSDLLLRRAISSLTGFNTMLTNIGSVENKGLEVALNSNIIDKSNFRWSISTTYTTNKNKITQLYGDGKDDIGNKWFIGQPVGIVYDYVFDGILQEGETAPEYMDNIVGIVGDGKNILPGEAKVKDIGGWKTLENGTIIRTKEADGKIDEADMTVIGQTQPKWIGSIGMQFRYKNFDASFLFNHVNGTLRRIPVRIYDRAHFLDIPYYTDDNPSSRYGRPAWPSRIEELSRVGNQFGYLSYYQSGTYTRLQDITLGYSLPQSLLSNIGLNNIRFYITGQNLFTITDYIGYDPSLEYTTISNQTVANVDRLYGYPTTRTWLFGVKVNF